MHFMHIKVNQIYLKIIGIKHGGKQRNFKWCSFRLHQKRRNCFKKYTGKSPESQWLINHILFYCLKF